MIRTLRFRPAKAVTTRLLLSLTIPNPLKVNVQGNGVLLPTTGLPLAGVPETDMY